MANYALRITTANQQALKQRFITYLQQTSEFQNFNTNASGLASFLDLISYDDYYKALTANMVFNESFLDTAIKRQNVVSRSNEMGYQPRSKRSSHTTLVITVKNVLNSPSVLSIPAGATFTSTVNGTSYAFTTVSPYSATIQYDLQNVPYWQFTVTVYEGVLTQNTMILGLDNTIQIPTLDLDTTLLRVYAMVNGVESEFYAPSNFLTINSNNKVYFLSESMDGFNCQFGDGTFGYQVPQGSAIRVQYVVTSGLIADGCTQFSMTSAIPNTSGATITTAASASSTGGAYQESVLSIKMNAGNAYAAQDRAVTPDDYKAIILKYYGSIIKDIVVWGGETMTPPRYGRVVVCALPTYGDSLTILDQQNIVNILAAKSVTQKNIDFTTAQYLWVIVNSTVKYDSTILATSSYDLQQTVQASISNYITNNLTTFNGSMDYSNFVGMIDHADAAVISNNTSLQLKYSFVPTIYQTNAITFTFKNKIDNVNKSYAMTSTLFYVSNIQDWVWLEDDDKGQVHLYYSKNGTKTFAMYNIGAIDYATGDVKINSLLITGIAGQSIDFTATPLNLDLASSQDLVFKVDAADIIVTPVKG